MLYENFAQSHIDIYLCCIILAKFLQLCCMRILHIYIYIYIYIECIVLLQAANAIGNEFERPRLINRHQKPVLRPEEW
jgi:hypothetical protein